MLPLCAEPGCPRASQSLGALAPRKGTPRRALRKSTLRAIAEPPPPLPPTPRPLENRGELSVPGTSAQRGATQLDAEARFAALEAQVAEVKAQRVIITVAQAVFAAFVVACAVNAARLWWPWVRNEEDKFVLQKSCTPACSLHSLRVPPPCRS